MLAAVSFLPVLLTPIPAMVDYPNHLARMYILSQNGTSNANPHYEVVWAFYPNLGMDLLVPQMARLMSVENATRLFLLLSQLLIVGARCCSNGPERDGFILPASLRSLSSTACRSAGVS